MALPIECEQCGLTILGISVGDDVYPMDYDVCPDCGASDFVSVE